MPKPSLAVAITNPSAAVCPVLISRAPTDVVPKANAVRIDPSKNNRIPIGADAALTNRP